MNMERIRRVLLSASQHGKTELNRIDYLDGWRGVAIISVLVSHFLPVHSMNLGRMGVDIFFVLSGMLMSNILFTKRVDIKTFYKRRISRVFPVFLLFVTFICGISYVFNLSEEHHNYFYIIAFLRSYFPEYPDIWHTGLPVGHIWSLNVEEHSYIILSIISLLTFIRGREYILLLALGGGIIVLHYFYLKHPEYTSGQEWELKTEIAASHIFLSAGYFLVKHRVKSYIRPWMPMLSMFLGILCYSKDAPWMLDWLFSPFFFAFTVNHLDDLSVSVKRLLSNNILRLFGIYSYSIYLWQQPLYYYGVKTEELFSFSGVILLIISCLVGVFSFYVVENPIRRYLNNNW